LLWDPLGNGRAKVQTSFSRSYELVPLGMWNRSVPSEKQVATFRQLCDQRTPSTSCAATMRDFVGGLDPTLVLNGTRGQFIDRIEAGGEYQVTSDLLVGTNYTNTRLGDAIEDYSTNNGANYYVGNPGPAQPGQTAYDPLHPGGNIPI